MLMPSAIFLVGYIRILIWFSQEKIDKGEGMASMARVRATLFI